MRKALLVVAVLTLMGCSQPSTPTSTTATPPPTARSSATTSTTTVSPTTTSTITTTTTMNLGEIDYPENPNTVDDLPDALTAYIGAPMPDPDLRIEGPQDSERWVAEWLNWMAWLSANPKEGVEAVDVGWLPEAPMAEQTRKGLAKQAAAGTRSLGVPARKRVV